MAMGNEIERLHEKIRTLQSENRSLQEENEKLQRALSRRKAAQFD
jgi:regulator of replication initiation timing